MYGRVFEHMYEGSMMGAGINVFAVWNYILTTGKFGSVEVNPDLVAFKLAGKNGDIQDSIRQVVEALEYLQSPDPNSRSKLEDGKRIVKEGQFQYRIVNWEYYESIRNDAERRRYVKNAVAKHRSKKSVDESCPQVSTACKQNPEVQKKPTKPQQNDSEWLASLVANPTYSGMDVNKEHGKCISWCSVNNRQPTRRMFVNWLNRAEKPMAANGAETSKKQPTVFELKTVIEAKTKTAEALKNKHATEGPLTTDWSNETAKESYKTLRKEIAELTGRLGNMAKNF